MTYGMFKRKMEMLRGIEAFLRKNLPINLDKAIAEIIYNTGLSWRKASEYIKVIVDKNGWVIENGIIKTKEKVESNENRQG